MLNTSNMNNCHYECNCNENEVQEAVLPSMELPEQKACPRDCKREEMIMKVRELDFAVEDISLYLNTHPDDRRALCLHNTYANQLRDVKDKYQKVYGPLTIDFPCNRWTWLEDPWPWERGNY